MSTENQPHNNRIGIHRITVKHRNVTENSWRSFTDGTLLSMGENYPVIFYMNDPDPQMSRILFFFL